MSRSLSVRQSSATLRVKMLPKCHTIARAICPICLESPVLCQGGWLGPRVKASYREASLRGEFAGVEVACSEARRTSEDP